MGEDRLVSGSLCFVFCLSEIVERGHGPPWPVDDRDVLFRSLIGLQQNQNTLQPPASMPVDRLYCDPLGHHTTSSA